MIVWCCREKLTIPATKPHITLQGAGMLMTIITHNDTANVTGSTSSSATISVDAAYFTARNITFQVLAMNCFILLTVANHTDCFFKFQDQSCDAKGIGGQK